MIGRTDTDFRTVDALLTAHPAPWLLRVAGGELGRVYAVEDAQGRPVATLADVDGLAAQLLGELVAALPELLAANAAAARVLADLCPVGLAGETLVERHPAPARLSLARRVCLAQRLTAAAGRRVRAALRAVAPREETSDEGAAHTRRLTSGAGRGGRPYTTPNGEKERAMPAIRLILDGDGAYPDLAGRQDRIIHLGDGAPPIGLSGLAGGMASGAPSVMLRLDLPDGRIVLAETSLKLFLTAADTLKARYGDPRY